MAWQAVNRIKWLMRRWQSRLTWPWLLLGGLLAFGIGFYLSVLEPTRNNLQSAQARLLALRHETHESERSPTRTAQPVAASQLAEFYQFFPTQRALPDLMEKIVKVAVDNKLTPHQGEYQVAHDKTGKLMRYQVTLPVVGAYPDIRGFINGVLGQVPNASLDNVKFERQKIGDGDVEATVLLTLYVGRDS